MGALLPSVTTHCSSHTHCHCTSHLCSRPIARYEDSFASERTHTTDVDSAQFHFTSELISNSCIRFRLDSDCLSLSFCRAAGGFCLSLSFNCEALGLGLRSCDYGVAFSICLGLDDKIIRQGSEMKNVSLHCEPLL